MSKIIPKKFGKAPSVRRGTPAVKRPARWVAWSNDGARVVARGASFEEARAAARTLGEPDPIVEHDPVRSRRA